MTTTAEVSDLAGALRAHGFARNIIEPTDPGYDAARAVWNGSVVRRPRAIAQCQDADDVRAAVSVAVSHELPIAVRAGGHSAAGHGTCDDGLVIDLSLMRNVQVDPEARLVRVGGGALLGDLDQATQQHGLAVPAGQVSHTGVAGLALGGGVGYLMRKYGLTIDSMKSAQVVTADGELVQANEDKNDDLFWALRGGGGNFGVVTELEFRLHEVGPLTNVAVLVFPYERAHEVLAASREVLSTASEDLSIQDILSRVPRHGPFPDEMQGALAVTLTIVHVGTQSDAEAEISPLRALGPQFEMTAQLPFVAIQSMLDGDNRHGLGSYTKSHWLTGYPDEFIDVLIEALPEAPSPLAHFVTAAMGGAISRVPSDATAFPHRDAARMLWIIDYWADAEADIAPHRAWVNQVHEATRGFSTGGGYVNAAGDFEGGGGVREAYGDRTFARLQEIKRRWDPNNVFRLNANISPT